MTERIQIHDINKPVPQATPVVQTPISTEILKPIMVDDIPLDMIRHFDIDHRNLDKKAKDMINDVYTWAANSVEEATMGNVLEFIRKIQLKLGGERSYSRVWNWLRIRTQIADMEKQQRALEIY